MKLSIGKLFLQLSWLLLLSALVFGYFASAIYDDTTSQSGIAGFLSLRPLHVSSAYFGIISAGIGFISLALQKLKTTHYGKTLQLLQFTFWLIALGGIFYNYLSGQFGGREYWEFHPVWAIPILISFFILLLYMLHQTKGIKQWPVYYWMWFTGIVFFMFCFLENYLWLFPYFKNHFIGDMTIQWKVNGAIVGAVNQLIYGSAFYIMAQLTSSDASYFKKEAFAMYFLGLFNLMFNWGHHIYPLPTERYLHHIAYAVSMTEWIILIRIFYLWKKQLQQDQKHYHLFSYKFLMASDYWVLLNLCLALFMSIPAFNRYTHGTHITVAHAMGTTIGINTMIILGASFYYFPIRAARQKIYSALFWSTQSVLLLFIGTLIAMGVHRSIWQMSGAESPFRAMFIGLLPYIQVFIICGIFLMLLLGILLVILLIKSFKNK